MAWVRIDEGFYQHPKVVRAGPLAMAMQVAALCYCNRNQTDGFVPRSVARTLVDWQMSAEDGQVWTVGRTSGMSGDDVQCDWVIDLLKDAGMWLEVPGGFRIHDYEDYQPTRSEVEASREIKREAGRLGGLARAKQAAKQPVKQTASTGASRSSSKRLAESKPGSETVTEPETVTETGSVSGTEELSVLQNTSLESSLAKPLAPLAEPAKANGYPADFEAFWTAYPRKESKHAAAKAWAKRIRKTPAEQIVAATRNFAEYVDATLTERQFIPHASTWLNQRRDDDFRDGVPDVGRLGPPSRGELAVRNFENTARRMGLR